MEGVGGNGFAVNIKGDLFRILNFVLHQNDLQKPKGQHFTDKVTFSAAGS